VDIRAVYIFARQDRFLVSASQRMSLKTRAIPEVMYPSHRSG
jgi:hypothetical protein